MKKSLLTKIVGTVLGIVLILASLCYIAYLIINGGKADGDPGMEYVAIIMAAFKVLGKIILVVAPIALGIAVFKHIYD